jgi:hypothetical protein
MRLIRDDGTAERCHSLARDEYSLDDAVSKLIRLYKELEVSK